MREPDRTRAARGSLIESILRPQIMVALAIIVAGIVLYGPARSYYSARRDASAYAAQLAAIEAKNEALVAEVEHLQTREGVEDEARKHGFVEPGETAVKVAGLPEAERDISVAATGVVAEEETPWYLSVLDFVFAYEPMRTAG